MSDEVCIHCGKEKGNLHPVTCPKSNDGRHSYVSRAYSAGTKAGNVLALILGALFKWLFSKPKVLAGLIFRGLIFGAVGFFIAAVVIMGASQNQILSYILGALAGIAVFGLYFWFFSKKMEKEQRQAERKAGVKPNKGAENSAEIQAEQESNKKKPFYTSTIFLCVVALAIGVGFGIIKSNSKSDTPKQTQQRQSPPQPTLVMPKCDDGNLLKFISDTQKNVIRKNLESDMDWWKLNKDLYAEIKGREFSSIDEYMSVLRFDLSNATTISQDEAKRQVECSVQVLTDYIVPDFDYSLKYKAQATETGINVDIIDEIIFDITPYNSANSSVASSNTASSSVASENSSPAVNQTENSSVSSVRLKTNDEYVNLRKAPSGEVLTPIYKKDFDKIVIKKLGVEGKWVRVRYYAPNVSDESKAITGYIHISQIDESSL